MAMDGGGDEDEPARPVRGPDVAIAALAEQDVVQCCSEVKASLVHPPVVPLAHHAVVPLLGE